MTNEPTFVTIGSATDKIQVRLSYRIIELFSEGLYASPNKAVEELVANPMRSEEATVSLCIFSAGSSMSMTDTSESTRTNSATALSEGSV